MLVTGWAALFLAHNLAADDHKEIPALLPSHSLRNLRKQSRHSHLDLPKPMLVPYHSF